jgi:hypothetical protein
VHRQRRDDRFAAALKYPGGAPAAAGFRSFRAGTWPSGARR